MSPSAASRPLAPKKSIATICAELRLQARELRLRLGRCSRTRRLGPECRCEGARLLGERFVVRVAGLVEQRPHLLIGKAVDSRASQIEGLAAAFGDLRAAATRNPPAPASVAGSA